MSDSSCPHCIAANQLDSRFCESCGKALPEPVTAGPRIVSNRQVAASEVGRSLQAEALRYQMRSARGALLALLILTIVSGFIVYAASDSLIENADFWVDDSTIPVLIASFIVIACLYLGLWVWAKVSPFAAVLSGLMLYITLWLSHIINDPSSQRNLIALAINIVVVLMLGKIVRKGLVYKRFMAHTNGRLG